MIKRSLFLNFIYKTVFLLLLILLTVFAFSYLNYTGSGFVWEEASKIDRKIAYMGLVGGIFISGYAFARFLELTEHISRHRKYLKRMTEELSPTPDFETIEEEADFHDKELKLLIYKNCLITYHNYFCFRKMDSQIWQIFLNKYQKYNRTKGKKTKSLLPPKFFLIVRNQNYREQFMPLRYKEKNWNRFSSYLADHYPAIELNEQVREIETM